MRDIWDISLENQALDKYWKDKKNARRKDSPMRMEATCFQCVGKFRVGTDELGEELDYDVINITITCPYCKSKKVIYSAARD